MTEPRHVEHRATKDAGKRAGLDKERKVMRMGKGRFGEGRREAKETDGGQNTLILFRSEAGDC